MAETSNARKRARDEEKNGAGGEYYGESLGFDSVLDFSLMF